MLILNNLVMNHSVVPGRPIEPWDGWAPEVGFCRCVSGPAGAVIKKEKEG